MHSCSVTSIVPIPIVPISRHVLSPAILVFARTILCSTSIAVQGSRSTVRGSAGQALAAIESCSSSVSSLHNSAALSADRNVYFLLDRGHEAAEWNHIGPGKCGRFRTGWRRVVRDAPPRRLGRNICPAVPKRRPCRERCNPAYRPPGKQEGGAIVIRSTALQSALTGMTAAHSQLAAAAHNLAKPLIAPRNEPTSTASQDGTVTGSQSLVNQSMSNNVGGSLIALNESLTQARVSSATAGAAQAMLDELLDIGRR